jgi:long-chain acyl-CoA synthetase
MYSAAEIDNDLNKLKDIVIRHKSADAPYAVGSKLIDGVDLPIFNKMLPNLHQLYRQSSEGPDLPFLVYADERYSFTESYQLASQLAQVLSHKYQIKKGDRVAICSRNNPQWCLAYMATTMLGAIVVPMNSWWQSSELLFGLKDSGSKMLFADQERIDLLAPHMDEIDLEIIAISPNTSCPFPEIHDTISLGSQFGDFDPSQHPVAPDDDASIMYTSGSSGTPKGVLSTHRAILSAVHSWHFLKEINEVLRPELFDPNPEFQPGILANVPLFHVTGSHVIFLTSVHQRRKIVMMYKWNPEKALELIEKERLSYIHGVPTMTWEIMNSPRFASTDLRSVRNVQSGGAARPPEHLVMMNEKFPPLAMPGLGYGLTETNALGATISGKFYLAKPASTGRACAPLTSIRIEDEAGAVLNAGEVGEICIKGPTLMKGYWNRPEDTATAIKDGWFHTGDLGYLDDQGFLFIKDRAKDIVIRGGENIGCAEVEYALAEHPDVWEAAVFGLPDDRLGETVAAAVMLKPDSPIDELGLQTFLSERIAKFKVPSRIWLQTEQLERIAAGKIAKKLVRARCIASLGSD